MLQLPLVNQSTKRTTENPETYQSFHVSPLNLTLFLQSLPTTGNPVSFIFSLRWPSCLSRSQLHTTTSTRSTLDPLQNPSIETPPKKSRQTSKAETKREREGKQRQTKRKQQKGVLVIKTPATKEDFKMATAIWTLRWGGGWCFTVSSFWRRSWQWRRRADLGPAQQTGG